MSVAVEILAQVPRFALLSGATRRALAGVMQDVRVRPGQYVVFEGDSTHGGFVVIEGRIRLARTAAEGREQVLDVVGPGELFNVVPLVDAGPAPATARAMAPSRCSDAGSATWRCCLRIWHFARCGSGWRAFCWPRPVRAMARLP